MLTIEKTNNSEEVALLIKFGERKHIKSLRNGNISVNNIGYYVKQELKTGKAGIGDKYDGATVIYNADIYLKPLEYNILKDINNIHFKANIAIHRNEDIETPIFCAVGIRKSELENKDGKLIFKFSKEEIMKLKEDFTEYTDVLIIPASAFADKVIKKSTKENISVDMGQVAYYEEDINQSKRVKDGFGPNIIFWKKRRFSNQREFRVAFPGEKISERKDLINIGNLKDISLMLDKDTVLDEKFELVFEERA